MRARRIRARHGDFHEVAREVADRAGSLSAGRRAVQDLSSARLTPCCISYHEHSNPAQLERVLTALDSGDVAQVTDAGSPTVSDPGASLVEAAVSRGAADLIAFGRPFLANPDLVDRFRNGWPLASVPAPSTWYSGEDGGEGYTDYPNYVSVGASA